jgi:hypothetical protein
MFETVQREKRARRYILRLFIKTLTLVLVINFSYSAIPSKAVDGFSLYNTLWLGRDRFPYGNAKGFTETILSLEALFASHKISSTPEVCEFRVALVGDSATWGTLLHAKNTYSGNINAQANELPDGRQVVAFNLGLPTSSAIKDVVILNHALQYDVDMILWLVTARTFYTGRQQHQMVFANWEATKPLVERFSLENIVGQPPIATRPDFRNQSLFSQRYHLGKLFRLQLFGATWSVLEIDHNLTTEYAPVPNDYSTDIGLPLNAWFDSPQQSSEALFEFGLIDVMMRLAADRPVVLINQPIFIATGENSHLHYNSHYPRWVYDRYRVELSELVRTNGWDYADLWDAAPQDVFTDSPVHLNAEGSAQISDQLIKIIQDYSAIEEQSDACLNSLSQE